MPADVRLFYDKECTKEIYHGEDGISLMNLCAEKCIDGYSGETVRMVIYLKNVGSRPAMHTTFAKYGDSNNYVNVRTAKSIYKKVLDIGDIERGGIVPLYITIAVPKYTNISIVSVLFCYYFYTLPDIDILCYNQYTKELCHICKRNDGRYYVTNTGEDVTKSLMNGDFYIQIGDKITVVTPENFEVN